MLWNERGLDRASAIGAVCPARTKARRFTHNSGDGLQTTWPQHGLGSFYFSGGGGSYSGSLDPSLPKTGLIDTGKRKPAGSGSSTMIIAERTNGVHFEISMEDALC